MKFPAIFDYTYLQDQFKDYGNLRAKIGRLLRDKTIIRIKKGLYIPGSEERQEPVQIETIANLIYGPSYVSYEFALAHYDLIPERVVEVTCATTQRNKRFDTPVGRFSYRHISPMKYQVGIVYMGTSLIASKEKALADRIAIEKPLCNVKTIGEFVVDGMRIDGDDLKGFDLPLMQKISMAYGNPNVRLLNRFLENL